MKTQLTAIMIAIMLSSYILPVSVSADDGWFGWLKSDSDHDAHDYDDKHHDKKHHHEHDDEYLTPVSNPDYRTECGSCHFAYQPGLLPARSWLQLMGNLENHFGDNAELEADVQKSLSAYLVKHAADLSPDEFSRKLMNRLSKNETPLRITELSYFVHEHDEVPQKMVSGNPQVKSLSYCDKCHTTADKGDYSEESINIPGYGRWED